MYAVAFVAHSVRARSPAQVIVNPGGLNQPVVLLTFVEFAGLTGTENADELSRMVLSLIER